MKEETTCENVTKAPVTETCDGAECPRRVFIPATNMLHEEAAVIATKPGAGGGAVEYEVKAGSYETVLRFQNKPIQASEDVNGLSNEILLAIVADRLEGFQKGPFSSRENALALTKIQEALHWLDHRTRDRVSRGVEGSYEK